MSGPLVVHLNRGELHEIEPTTSVYETDGSFEVALRNHGQAVHVHLRLDGALSSVASLPDPNYFVATDATETVRIDVQDGAEVRGSLEVVSGYGKTDARVRVHVGIDDDPPVEVGDSLATPESEADAEGLPETFARSDSRQVVALAALALGAAATAIVLAPSAVVAAGALVVVLAITAAGYLLVG